MSSWRARLAEWRQDHLLRRVVRNSGYLFSSTTVSAALGFFQGILAVRLLGIADYGLVSGIITQFASNVNRLLSFRMSEVMVKYLGQALMEGKKERAAALVKGIGLSEAAASVLAYLVLLALAPWAARVFAKDAQTAPLFAFYGLFLLANLVYETSTGVLQATDRFDRLAVVGLIQSVITAVLILAAFLLKGGVFAVLAAYLIGKSFAGIAVVLFAVGQLNRTLEPGWHKVSLRLLPDWREIGRFALTTNLDGTVNLFVRDNVSLYLGAFRSKAEVGYFNLASSLINFVTLPIEPFIQPTYAELTRTIARREWARTRHLLRRVSGIAAAWTLSAGGGLAALGWWLIPFVYGADTAPVYPAAIILLIGFGFANILHWNRPLLLAFGKPWFPLLAKAVVGVVEIGLIFSLVPAYGYLAQSAILSAFFVGSIGWIVWRGLALLQQAETNPS